MAPATDNPVLQAWSQSVPRRASIADESLARDLSNEDATYTDYEDNSITFFRRQSDAMAQSHALAGSWRRMSVANAGSRAIIPMLAPEYGLTTEEQSRVLQEEAALLRDNNLIPAGNTETNARRKSSFLNVLPISRPSDTPPDETSPLLGTGPPVDASAIGEIWDKAVAEGKINTSWQRETKVALRYSIPLMVTFLLQYSLTVASIFTVGHIGVAELGAVSLAAMTANITGYAIYQGLATSLDTLCAQAYGSGRKKLVGLQMQRMIWFLWLVTVPIGVIWLLADKILLLLLPEKEQAVAHLAGIYLKIVLIGAPGYATFEAAKRYVQAQGMFLASMYVLFVLAPFNAFLNWLLVWKLDFGFKGAPIAVAVTNNLLPVGLWIYVRFISSDGMSCWDGFSRRALSNWGPMIKLAIPGLIMIEAEMLAFEILTFAATYFGTSVLAAQSVLASICQITFQIPFPLSIAGATRVANLIGATLVDAAKLSSKVTLTLAIIVGITNVTLLSVLRSLLPQLFTSDPEVIEIAASILPLCAAFQLFDSIAACCNGMLRALGKQEFGGYLQLFCYYVIALPISFGTGFGLGWGLRGLWIGVALALVIVAVTEYIYLYRIFDWNKAVEEAQARNLAEERRQSEVEP